MEKPREDLPLQRRHRAETLFCSQTGEGHCGGGLHHRGRLLDTEKGQWNKDKISEFEVQAKLFLLKGKKSVFVDAYIYTNASSIGQ